MKVVVTSTVVLDVPDLPIEEVSRLLLESNKQAEGKRWKTTSGVPYVMVRIEQFAVTRRGDA